MNKLLIKLAKLPDGLASIGEQSQTDGVGPGLSIFIVVFE